MCIHKRILAVENDFGQVTECDCGTIHMTAGPMSIALNYHTFRKLHALLMTAMEQLHDLPANTSMPEEESGPAPHVQ